jgi:hypothetical protein
LILIVLCGCYIIPGKTEKVTSCRAAPGSFDFDVDMEEWNFYPLPSPLPARERGY